MTQMNDWQAVAPMFMESETATGTDIYAHIECFRGKPGQKSARPFRMSAPFVFSRRYGSRQVVLGSVCETLRNIRNQIGQLAESTERRGRRSQIDQLGGPSVRQFCR